MAALPKHDLLAVGTHGPQFFSNCIFVLQAHVEVQGVQVSSVAEGQ